VNGTGVHKSRAATASFEQQNDECRAAAGNQKISPAGLTEIQFSRLKVILKARRSRYRVGGNPGTAFCLMAFAE
jgi:hypothetical protein